MTDWITRNEASRCLRPGCNQWTNYRFSPALGSEYPVCSFCRQTHKPVVNAGGIVFVRRATENGERHHGGLHALK